MTSANTTLLQDAKRTIIPLSGCISANFVSNDELILFMEKQDLNILQNNIQELLNKYEFASFFKAESFDIEIIHEDCYKKTLFNGKISVRNTPAIIFPQIYKKIKGLEINDNDLIFYEGQQKALAKFIKPIF